VSGGLTILSLGAGVQSTTMALMAAHGEIGPMPDCAIFADTQWEPKRVYQHLDWLEQQLPFPVYRVTAGNIYDDLRTRNSKRSGRFVTIPSFLLNGQQKGIGRRQCTSHYKIEPIQKKKRELLGYKPRQRIPPNSVESWLGISTDEVIRVTPSKIRWETKRFPLIEKLMNRNDCLRWLERNGYPAPHKSACIGCPYHSNVEWRAIKTTPEEWKQAVEVDAAIRDPVTHLRATQYLHRDCIPLTEVDLSTPEDHGQLNLFINECEGMCGV
jgi:hypothetical protein